MPELSARETALPVLRTRGRRRDYAPRQTIFGRGERGDSLAVIESGVVRISVSNADGRELTLALLGPGDVIGEISVIDRKDRAADVIAAGRVTLTLIPAHAFRDLMYSDRTVMDFFLHLLCDRIRTANAHAESHALTSLAGRLTIYIMNNGQELPDGSLILPNLPSQSELARLVGVTRESVNRQFRAWRDQGLVNPVDDVYQVPDPVRLQESVLAD